ncbi:MAG: AAA family ATPase [Nitrospirae bacterium]|nr:AAA family ATPase [Nitrospirota bacterium]
MSAYRITERLQEFRFDKETIPTWINQTKQLTVQAIIPDAETISLKGKQVVILSVPESPIKPVSCKGRYYRRVKNANHQLSVSEVVNMHLRTFNSSWDFHIDEYHTEKEISLVKVQNFIERVNLNKEKSLMDDPLTVLQKFELMREGKITYACLLLFMAGESFISTIELGRFQTETIIKDGATLKTDLFSEVDGVMDFIKKHINKAYIITGRPQREERWDYPLDAIREIVINAIIHRDYTSTADSIIKVFDDKIQFFNPGGLPEGITIEKLLKGNYVSNARNKKVAEVFKAAGLIERYGSGINRILNAFKAYGLPPPEFKEITPGFMVTVYKAVSKVTPQVTEQVTEQVAEQVARLVAAFPEKAASTGELMDLLTLSHRPSFLYTYLQPALEVGYIERTIPDKPQSRLQRYRLTAKGRQLLERLKK